MTTVEYVSDPDRYSEAIKRLLVVVDDEFVPPLSAREGTTQRSGLSDAERETNAEVSEAIETYHEACLEQHLILCHDDGELAGFMSFRDGYETPELGSFQPSNYVSTIAVDPEFRREGLARRMYGTILSDLPEEITSPYVSTRTWSSNESHLSLLAELGFQEVETIPDDRGDGVDTVYYAVSRSEFE
ncbi:GNAT family N-acetyltransferase [Natrarchaeobius chitinivorans]|uniref:N-acetyltransferase n=1 Tax=Natrarchaeobius chitinivorans TaxID=1679083 RepID=A0A3N6M6S9_NATCH|nr:N-acetyltransferase [Natrarchaeobius chitinivorans]RQG91810.1 N-acetyltransferase [Natrarchaeobius chitinivorans]